MSHPLSDQRAHSDLIVELYDRHAAGLFAYCFDQLGDKGAAADAVIAVLTSVPVGQPRRALLYALARREIHRRDVVYFPPMVDFAVDPATALIERVVRDLRPHQREVLLLSAVCRLAPDELADVLDVAIDTAGQLIVSARNRFAQSMQTALYHARHAEYVPERVAEVYGALEVAPIEDALARLPWQRPPGDLRNRLLALLPQLDPAGTTKPKTRLPVKQLWPTAPAWPLPLSDPDQTTTTSLIPVVPPESDSRPAPAAPDAGRPRRGGRVRHDATTEPIPRLQGSILAAMAEAKAFRPWSRKAQPSKAPEGTESTKPTEATAAEPSAPSVAEERKPVPLSAPVPADVIDAPPAPPAEDAPVAETGTADAEAVRTEVSGVAAPAEAERAAGKPGETTGDAAATEAKEAKENGGTEGTGDAEQAKPRRRRPGIVRDRRRHRKYKPLKLYEHRFDWLWELAGLVLAIAIALIVFFSIPMIVTP